MRLRPVALKVDPDSLEEFEFFLLTGNIRLMSMKKLRQRLALSMMTACQVSWIRLSWAKVNLARSSGSSSGMFDAEVLEVSHGMLAAVRDIRLLSLPGPASKLKKGTEVVRKSIDSFVNLDCMSLKSSRILLRLCEVNVWVWKNYAIIGYVWKHLSCQKKNEFSLPFRHCFGLTLL